MSSLFPRFDSLGEESLVEDLADCLRQLDQIEADAGKLVAGLNEEQFHWSPASSRWSSAQCLVHLVIIGRRYLPVLDEATERANAKSRFSSGPFHYGFLERWIVRST